MEREFKDCEDREMRLKVGEEIVKVENARMMEQLRQHRELA